MGRSGDFLGPGPATYGNLREKFSVSNESSVFPGEVEECRRQQSVNFELKEIQDQDGAENSDLVSFLLVEKVLKEE